MSASSALYRGFIAPCLARSTVEGRANHTGRRLAVETSVFVLLAGAWLWGIVVLSAHATAAQGYASTDGGPSESAVVSCPAPREPEKERDGLSVSGDVCHPEPRLHAGISRQPGRGLESGHARRTAERIPKKLLSQKRSSENAISRKYGE